MNAGAAAGSLSRLLAVASACSDASSAASRIFATLSPGCSCSHWASARTDARGLCARSSEVISEAKPVVGVAVELLIGGVCVR